MSTPRPASIGVRVTLLCSVAVALAACGISADERVTHIPADDLGALANTTTTSTTTTTTTTTTLPPETSPPTSTPPSLPFETTTTSTIEVVPLEDVDIFYVPRGRDETVKKVTVQQVGEPTLNDVIGLLAEPPAPVRNNSNLTTEVTPDLVRRATMQRLYTVVDLDRETFERMSDPNQRQAIAQLVLTLTSFVSPDRGAIGAVVFTVDGEDIQIPIPELGASDPGEPIAFRDFASWVDTNPTGDPVAVTNAPTTTPPATTDPPGPPGGSAPGG